jgi:hypothetical protein
MLKHLDIAIGFVTVITVASLLIMVVTQACSSLLALRGRNLLDALEALFLRFDPALKSEKGNKARALAEVILKRPTISDSVLSVKGNGPESWKLATAITSDECLNAIKRIAALDKDQLASSLSAAASASIEHAQDAARSLIGIIQSSDTQQAARDALTAVKSLDTQSSSVADLQVTIKDLLTHLASTAETEAHKWSTAFQTVQDRAAQWFTMHTRMITVIASFVGAFILQLDAFQLLANLSTDTDFRNGLVSISKDMQQRADDALNVDFGGTSYSSALKDIKGTNEDVKKFADTPQVETYHDGVKWLKGQILTNSLDSKKEEAILDAFNEAVQRESRARLEAAQKEFGGIAGIYDQSKIQLIPEPYFGHFSIRHFCGISASAMLLTLGAPFWFNILKSLTSLRSALAEQIDKGERTSTA